MLWALRSFYDKRAEKQAQDRITASVSPGAIPCATSLGLFARVAFTPGGAGHALLGEGASVLYPID